MSTVITYGTFDVFHHGHRRLLERAKALGERLIVGVTSADYDRARGKLNVKDSLPQRIKSVEQTGLADLILVEEHDGQKIRDIQQYDVDIFAIGSDWEGHFDYLSNYCSVVYLERTAGVSSTQRRADSDRVVRLGIIGTGRIARRMVAEARFVSGVEVVSAFNPHAESAVHFVSAHTLAAAHSEWRPFVDEVDAVYVASPHHTHAEYSLMAIDARKHVLCEKPASLDRDQLAVVIESARQKDVVFLEALKTAFLPGFERMVNLVRSGVVGEVRAVRSAFTKLVPPGGREWSAPYGGSMTELGSYGLLPIIRILGAEVPRGDFTVVPHDGVDAFTSGRFEYSGALGAFDVGIGVKTEGTLVISGTSGFLKVPAPWWLTDNFEVHREDSTRTTRYSFPFEGDGLRYELSEFVKTVQTPGRRVVSLAHEESMAMARVQHEFIAVTSRASLSPGAMSAIVQRQGGEAIRVAALGLGARGGVVS